MSEEIIQIRPFQAQDIDSVVSIERKVFPAPWSERSFLDCAQWKEFWFRVGELEGQVVGYFVAQVVEGEAELHNIAVDPHFQKRGFGHQLLEYFLSEAKKVGVKDVFLMVRPSNLAAIQLYQFFEFVLLDRRPKFYEDTQEEALIFYKRLDS